MLYDFKNSSGFPTIDRTKVVLKNISTVSIYNLTNFHFYSNFFNDCILQLTHTIFWKLISKFSDIVNWCIQSKFFNISWSKILLLQFILKYIRFMTLKKIKRLRISDSFLILIFHHQNNVILFQEKIILIRQYLNKYY